MLLREDLTEGFRNTALVQSALDVEEQVKDGQ